MSRRVTFTNAPAAAFFFSFSIYFSAPTSSLPNKPWLNEVIIFTGDISHRKIAARYITSHHMVMAVKHRPIRRPQLATVVHVVIKQFQGRLWHTGKLFDQTDCHLWILIGSFSLEVSVWICYVFHCHRPQKLTYFFLSFFCFFWLINTGKKSGQYYSSRPG